MDVYRRGKGTPILLDYDNMPLKNPANDGDALAACTSYPASCQLTQRHSHRLLKAQKPAWHKQPKRVSLALAEFIARPQADIQIGAIS